MDTYYKIKIFSYINCEYVIGYIIDIHGHDIKCMVKNF